VRVERLEREYEIDVDWQPYELHPEFPAEGIDRGGSGRRSPMYERLREMAREAGLTFQPSTHVPNSHRSLEAAEFAREHGAFAPYHRSLFDAFFSRGRDIGDVKVLTELGEAAGLDAGALEQALTSKRYAALVDQRTAEAKRSGITGTPTFVFRSGEREFPMVGAQDYAVFENVAQRMGAGKRTENLEPRTEGSYRRP